MIYRCVLDPALSPQLYKEMVAPRPSSSRSCTDEQFKYDFKWFKDDFDTEPKMRGRLFTNRSPMEEERSRWEPPIPLVFQDRSATIDFRLLPDETMDVDPEVAAKWPEFAHHTVPVTLRAVSSVSPSAHPESPAVGVILTGEWVPSSGTHNVIVGIVRYLYSRFSNPTVLGFLGGPQGFARRHYVALTPDSVAKYLNQGGADFLGFGSLRAIDESDAAEINVLCREYNLHSLVFVGGPNELSHVSQIVHYSQRLPVDVRTTIIGIFQSPNSNVIVPSWIPVTLGYDSTRCTLTEYVGNIAMDGLSSGRSVDVNFIRCGSTTVTMEIALQVRPAMTVVAHELKAKGTTVQQLVNAIANMLRERVSNGVTTATILISDQFYQFLTGLSTLQSECRALYLSQPVLVSPAGTGVVNPLLYEALTAPSRELLKTFQVSDQLRIARGYDSDGNPTWPDMDPERYLARLTAEAVRGSIHPPPVMRTHYIGHEGRCPLPTDFDCSLGLALGYTAAALCTDNRFHGYIAAVRNLTAPVGEWVCGGFPLAPLLSIAEPATHILSTQHGGANQELINLARQRVEREAEVPIIKLRPQNILEDPLYLAFANACRTGSPRQPGPYQFGTNEPSFALRVSGSGHAFTDASDRTDLLSRLQAERLGYQPRLPDRLALGGAILDSQVTTHRSPIQLVELAFPITNSVSAVCVDSAPTNDGGVWTVGAPDETEETDGMEEVTPRCQPTNSLSAMSTRLRIGIVFLGRHAAGCHNIVWGLRRYLDSVPGTHTVVGFLQGSLGFIRGNAKELSHEVIDRFRNQSGIDMLGRTEAPITTREEMMSCVLTCKRLRLDGVVVVGGLGTHADTALLAELVAAHKLPTKIIGVPSSVENDIPLVEQSLGHDTACRVYSSIIGSLATLAASSKRQWCFVRIAGRSLSHIVTEIGLQTHPNLILVAEELTARRMSLADTVNLISDLITERARNGLDFGIVIFAESILETVEEIARFTTEVQSTHIRGSANTTNIVSELSPMSAALFEALPERARMHVLHALSHGCSTVRLIEPEILLESLVGKELQRRRIFETLKGSFRSSTHALSHQGRSSLPSPFDCDLGFAMGYTAGMLVANNRTGLLVNMTNLAAPPAEWIPRAVPLTSLLSMEFDSEHSECRMEISQRRVEYLHPSLPPPSKRRFISPGAMQFTDTGPSRSLQAMSSRHSRQEELVIAVSALCSRIMSQSANAADESVRDVIQSGLTHTLKLLRSVAPPVRRPRVDPRASRSAEKEALLRPLVRSHCRVVKIVPVAAPSVDGDI